MIRRIENWLKTQTKGDDEWQRIKKWECVCWGLQESEQDTVMAKYLH